MLRKFLGVLQAGQLRARPLDPSRQHSDGTWANFYGGPGDLSTTVEAYVALRLAGDPADAQHMRRARRVHPRRGRPRANAASSPVCGWRCSALWSWDDLPVLPPELIFFPRGCRSTSTTGAAGRGRRSLPLTIVAAHRPAPPAAASRSTSCTATTSAAPPPRGDAWARRFDAARPCAPPLTNGTRPALCGGAALRRAAEWIIDRQEADGSLGRHPAAVGLLDRWR